MCPFKDGGHSMEVDMGNLYFTYFQGRQKILYQGCGRGLLSRNRGNTEASGTATEARRGEALAHLKRDRRIMCPR